MTDRHYEIERTMTKTSTGGTVTQTTTGESSRTYKYSDDDDDNDEAYDFNDEENPNGLSRVSPSRSESKPVHRKRRRTEPASQRTGIPRKTPRWTGDEKDPTECPPNEDAAVDQHEKIHRDSQNETTNISALSSSSPSSDPITGNDENISITGNDENISKNGDAKHSNEIQKTIVDNVDKNCNSDERIIVEEKILTNEGFVENDDNSGFVNDGEAETLSRKPPIHPDVPSRRIMGLAGANRRDDSARLRKTIQWLEEGARKLRENLAEARTELHEERRASRLARREIEVAVREARAIEAARHQRVIAELKTRLSQSPSRSTTELSPAITKAELLKDENHRREISAAKKRLAEADATIRKLRSNSLESVTGVASGKRRKVESPSTSELRRLDSEVKNLRAANKKLEEKLNMVCTEAEKIRIMELRIQHENHESELNALKKSLRSDTIKMMDEIRNKDREIEKLGRLARENRKSRAKHDDEMRKLRENENGHQIRLAARIEDKIPQVENGIDLFKSDCEAVAEVERLRELAIEQQEFIEVLRQAVKEKERKLDQLSNKKRKEEFYKQWLELEPVAEVDDEEEHEEGDSALSSAPSSLSPQPGGCGQWQTNGVTREAYEAVLLEIDEIQTKFIEEQRELVHAKSQVRDLEKALLQETRGSQNSRRALSEKLRKIEEREAGLLAEISELRDQNELLEFRVLELEESPGSRETPDTADSGIVSPEPINIFKHEQNSKQRDRAVATVLPFSSYTHPTSPVPVKKPPLSLQESGIFEDDDEETDDDMEPQSSRDVELTHCGTQTEAPVGELLQEVQRLQELRERIQERAHKVPANPTFEANEAKNEEDKTFYREKIRALEEMIAERDEKDEKRMNDDFVAKQREEDLLDENYRLTERVYWLENELRRANDVSKTVVDAETMTEAKISSIDEETMTENHRRFRDAETTMDRQSTTVGTMTPLTFSSKLIRDDSLKIDDNNCHVSVVEAKRSTMKIDGLTIETKLGERRTNDDGVDDCSGCDSLRRDYDEKIRELGKVECRFRGRLDDPNRKEGGFAQTLKHVDVTWSQLKADHAKKLEEIGRRLEEKSECNRGIMRRAAELEEIEKSEETKKSCSCECNDCSLACGGISSAITSADAGLRRGRRDVDEPDAAMDVDFDDRENYSERVTGTIADVDRMVRTDGRDFEGRDCETSESLERLDADESPKKIVDVPTIDGSTEMAMEAGEEIDGNSTTIVEIEADASRVLAPTKEDTTIPELAENRRVTINETEIDKKVVYFRWR